MKKKFSGYSCICGIDKTIFIDYIIVATEIFPNKKHGYFDIV